MNNSRERLVSALRICKLAALDAAGCDDRGTCNFDAPALDYRESGITKQTAEKAIEAAGLSCFRWGKSTVLVIEGFQNGQANRRTKMSKAFCDALKDFGYCAFMYYCMD